MNTREFAAMSQPRRTPEDEVDHLLRNAQLRDDLEPYFDESISRIETAHLPTPVENEFLASMLAWERAPALPISRWFDPPIDLPSPDALNKQELHDQLWLAIHLLFEKRILLEFTDHLSDRQLYTVIVRDILPSNEKKIEEAGNYLHWDCADAGDSDPEIWLRYYASEEEREGWAEDTDYVLPPMEDPPYPRDLPRRPM